MSDAAITAARAAPGAGGGIVALLATYPLMTINTLQQTRGRRKQEAGEAPPVALSVLAELKDVSSLANPTMKPFCCHHGDVRLLVLSQARQAWALQ